MRLLAHSHLQHWLVQIVVMHAFSLLCILSCFVFVEIARLAWEVGRGGLHVSTAGGIGVASESELFRQLVAIHDIHV